MDVNVAILRERVLNLFAGLQQYGKHFGIRMNCHGSIDTVGRSDQAQAAAFFRVVEILFLIAGVNANSIGYKPYLQEMDFLGLRRVEFAMLHPCAGAHPLNVAGANNGTITHTVLMGKGSVQHVADDFHIAVTVRAETASRLDGIVIDYAQRAKLNMLGIVVVGEGKAVPGIQPAVIRVTSVPRGS